MLQNLVYGRLENEFYHLQPNPEDFVVCFQNNQVLLKQEGDQFLLPTVAEVTALTEQWNPWYEEGLRYVFRIQEKNCFLWLGDLREEDCVAFSLEPVRLLRYKAANDLCFGVWTAAI